MDVSFPPTLVLYQFFFYNVTFVIFMCFLFVLEVIQVGGRNRVCLVSNPPLVQSSVAGKS